MKNPFVALAFSLVATMSAHATPIADEDLAVALDAHVKAVQSRDIAALEDTITTDDTLDLILPNGKRTTTRSEYIAFHRAWFKETNWTWTLNPLAVATTNDMAIVTARTRYEERDGPKISWSENWLSLAFRKEDGTWRLIHDQNTRIATGP